MRYNSSRLVRTHEMRTFRLGSSLPPHSMAFVSNSRNADATASRTASGRLASRCMTNDWMRSAISSVQGATSSSHSGFADITSIGSAAAGCGQRLVDDVDDGVRGKRLSQVAIGLTPNGLEQRRRRVVGGHDDDERRRRQLADACQHVEPAHAREPDVQENQVERRTLRPASRALRVRRRPIPPGDRAS